MSGLYSRDENLYFAANKKKMSLLNIVFLITLCYFKNTSHVKNKQHKFKTHTHTNTDIKWGPYSA